MFSRAARGLALVLILGVFLLPTRHCWSIFSSGSSNTADFFKKCNLTNVTIDCFLKKINEIPKAAFINSTFIKVDLRLNGLKNLTKDQFRGGKRLKSLLLSYNTLNYIEPGTFDSFLHLERLYLDHNELHKLDSGMLRGLSNLKALYIGHNQMVSIDPKSFEENHDLDTLSLVGNLLITLKSTHSFLDSAPKLMSLDLSATKLREIPSRMFRNLTNLRRLTISNNNFTSVPTNAIKSLSKLAFLDISANPMKSIKRRAFVGLSKLQVLRMNNMPELEKLREGVFDGLPNLQILYCSYNYKLIMLHRWAFTGEQPVRRMRAVNLKSNSLKMLHEDTLPWRDIYSLDLTNNPWNCDCDITWMITLRVPVEMQPNFKCSTPPKLAGKKIVLARPLEFTCFERSYGSIAAIIFISAILVIISVTVIFVLLFRMKTCVKLRAANQTEYKVFSNKSMVEITVNDEPLDNRVGVIYGTKEIELNNSGDEDDDCYVRNQRKNESDA